jgi:hypothetical protein
MRTLRLKGTLIDLATHDSQKACWLLKKSVTMSQAATFARLLLPITTRRRGPGR